MSIALCKACQDWIDTDSDPDRFNEEVDDFLCVPCTEQYEEMQTRPDPDEDDNQTGTIEV